MIEMTHRELFNALKIDGEIWHEFVLDPKIDMSYAVLIRCECGAMMKYGDWYLNKAHHFIDFETNEGMMWILNHAKKYDWFKRFVSSYIGMYHNRRIYIDTEQLSPVNVMEKIKEFFELEGSSNTNINR